MAEVRKIFARNLARLLKEQGLNQAKLAKLMNTDQAKIHKWAKEKAWPEPESVDELCRVLNVSPSALFIDPTDEREKKVWPDATILSPDAETVAAWLRVGEKLGIKS